jgi:hypothetical protein
MPSYPATPYFLTTYGNLWFHASWRSTVEETNGGFRPILIVASMASPLLRIKSPAMHKSRFLFSALDRVEGIFGEPGHGHFLLGDTITERNIRLFTTIVKFNFTYFIQCFTLWVETHWVLIRSFINGCSYTSGISLRCLMVLLEIQLSSIMWVVIPVRLW